MGLDGGIHPLQPRARLVLGAHPRLSGRDAERRDVAARSPSADSRRSAAISLVALLDETPATQCDSCPPSAIAVADSETAATVVTLVGTVDRDRRPRRLIVAILVGRWRTGVGDEPPHAAPRLPLLRRLGRAAPRLGRRRPAVERRVLRRSGRCSSSRSRSSRSRSWPASSAAASTGRRRQAARLARRRASRCGMPWRRRCTIRRSRSSTGWTAGAAWVDELGHEVDEPTRLPERAP